MKEPPCRGDRGVLMMGPIMLRAPGSWGLAPALGFCSTLVNGIHDHNPLWSRPELRDWDATLESARASDSLSSPQNCRTIRGDHIQPTQCQQSLHGRPGCDRRGPGCGDCDRRKCCMREQQECGCWVVLAHSLAHRCVARSRKPTGTPPVDEAVRPSAVHSRDPRHQ